MKQYEILLTLLKKNRHVECDYAKRMGVNNPRQQASRLRQKGHVVVTTNEPGTYKLCEAETPV